jgi:hypothetical protein
MTKKWFLVEEANRNMNIAMICTDTIYAINQLSGEPKWNAEKLESSIENGKRFLGDFSTAVESLYRSDVFSDPSMFSLADETAKQMEVRPKQLLNLTRKAISDLSDKFLSYEAYLLLTSVIKIAQQAAVHKCESIKPIIL